MQVNKHNGEKWAHLESVEAHIVVLNLEDEERGRAKWPECIRSDGLVVVAPQRDLVAGRRACPVGAAGTQRGVPACGRAAERGAGAERVDGRARLVARARGRGLPAGLGGRIGRFRVWRSDPGQVCCANARGRGETDREQS